MALLRSWAMKMAATASYKAVPSMLTVAPTGMTNRVTRGSMPISSNVLIVTGIVAELWAGRKALLVLTLKSKRYAIAHYLEPVPNAVAKFCPIREMYENGKR